MNPENEGVRIVASLMTLSAKTAPKGKGVDSIVTAVLYEKEIAELSSKMKEIGESSGFKFITRDAENMAASDACVLIGCKGDMILGLNCGGCGYKTCKEMADAYKNRKQDGLYSGPNCILKMADLGIAVGSAVKTAQMHNVDNRILFSGGTAALALGMLEGCTVAYAIPLSATGKNIFFDRKSHKQ